MLSHPLLPKLKALKLSGILDTLEQHAQTAQEQALAPMEFLALLLDDELERREQHRLHSRIKESGIEENKTLGRFDFAATPRVPKTLLPTWPFAALSSAGKTCCFAAPRGRASRTRLRPWPKKPSSTPTGRCIVPRTRSWPRCTPAGPTEPMPNAGSA